MWLVVGLGNPGPRYAATRHNIGFRVVDQFATGADWRHRFHGETAQVEVAGAKVLLLKPQTYMNESGQCVRQAADYFRIAPDQTVVVHDELDLDFGQLRLKRNGGEAGHNGLRSVSKHLGTQDYFRLRMGIGRPSREFAGQGRDFVLDAFAPHELEPLVRFIEQGSAALRRCIEDGPSAAMNEINRKR